MSAAWASDGGGGRAGASAGRTVLLVVQDPLVRELIASALRRAGCDAPAVATLADGQRIVEQIVPDAIVLDLDPDPGTGTLRELDLSHLPCDKAVPLLRLCAPGSDCAETLGDRPVTCVHKPIEPRRFVHDLMQRLRARPEPRKPARARPPLRLAGIEVDRGTPTARVWVAGQWRELDLRPVEHRLLNALLDQRSRVLKREALCALVWEGAEVSPRTVDQNVRRLRAALAAVGAPDIVRTVPTAGYRIEIEALAPDSGLHPSRDMSQKIHQAAD
jgi:two-component system, OmpR family, phosphate regulon response regulator PhoB